MSVTPRVLCLALVLAGPWPAGGQALSPSRILSRGHLPRTAVLSYHQFVSDEDARGKPSRLDDLTMSRSQFRAHLNLLLAMRANFLTPAELLRHVRGEEVAPERSVLLVIDDGYESVHSIAWPLLAERKIPFTVSLIVRATEEPEAWKRDHPWTSPHLTWDQIREMAFPRPGSPGPGLLTLASHTYDMHRNLRDEEGRRFLSDPLEFYGALTDDLWRARRVIARRTGGVFPAEFLVWPHGGYSPILTRVAIMAGHRAAFTELGPAVPPGQPGTNITRVHAGSGHRNVTSFLRALGSAGWSVPASYRLPPAPLRRNRRHAGGKALSS